jgi:hypothetical protein
MVFSPQADYTDRATATCVEWSAQYVTSDANLGFLVGPKDGKKSNFRNIFFFCSQKCWDPELLPSSGILKSLLAPFDRDYLSHSIQF